MANKMLVDASHPEETRVVVVKGNRIEEFDFESEYKKQIKGNIYLAKVTRVEPSLQAAFVEYGGNRHGFLAFSEIHPDYYQIPVADRQALVEDDLARAKEEEEQEERKFSREDAKPAARAQRTSADASVSEPLAEADQGVWDSTETEGDLDWSPARNDGQDGEETDGPPVSDVLGELQDAPVSDTDFGSADAADSNHGDDASTAEASTENEPPRRGRRHRSRRRGNGAEDDIPGDEEEEVVEDLGSEDAMEEVPVRTARPPRRQYKIQEVIKRRQILLVQVVKEERGNKGAALTTYLSLAGRYSVLMPNTARGGGISRKITNIADRKRLKEVVRELEVPRGMGIILRTAGAMRTKAEVKRDYEYLMRLWETVRNLTLSSTAPALVYEEGSLIKRSIRDLYNKDIDQVLVSGEEGYREAKDFMRMLMPSQAKVVQPYRDPVPIFARGGIEAQLDRMLQPHVTLKSGGYIIINQTEALVAIDVNSGRSTREHSIEDTAVQTNLEAAEEVARQLRLRDLAGLIVIDFIDMDEKRNNRAVEKRIKDCLKEDRARIQVGRISHFGLLEMSRQRIRASVLESTTQTCPTCAGVGHIRSDSSLALHVVRSIEEHLQKDATHDLVVKMPTGIALYVLNEKRKSIDDLEAHHGLRILVQADDTHGHQHVAIEHGPPAAPRPVKPDAVSLLTVAPDIFEAEDEIAATADAEADIEAVEPSDESGSHTDEGGRRKRRRRRGGRREEPSDEAPIAAEGNETDNADTDEETELEAETKVADDHSDDEQEQGRKRRRRGRRGGKRERDDASENDKLVADDSGAAVHAIGVSEDHDPHTSDEDLASFTSGETIVPDIEPADAGSASQSYELATEPTTVEPETPVAEDAEVSESKQPELVEPVLTTSGMTEDEVAEPTSKRTGWWARRSFF